MNKKELSYIKENYFEEGLDIGLLFEMIEQVEEEVTQKQLLQEKEGGRFSFSVDIPTWTPSEAWGDPNSADREQIQKIFSVVRGKTMQARIADINKFLDPVAAKRKRSPSVIINMMMIAEALQATLNDYNESAAGFVFEGFMAALTGGHQVAGKVEGTLPIEDFVAFSSFGQNQPVSLKLLSGNTPIKGSFTNIVDFLLVRGASAIKYLVAYKLTSGADVVQKLNIYAFDITRENFVDFMGGVGGGESLLSGVDREQLKAAFQGFTGDSESLSNIANMVIQLGGYSARGLLHKVARGEEITKSTPEEEALATAATEKRREEEYESRKKFSHPEEWAAWNKERLAKRAADRAAKRAADRDGELALGQQVADEMKRLKMRESLNEALSRGELSMNEAFHYIEKFSIPEASLLSEGDRDGDKSQWAASYAQLGAMKSLINLEPFGEIDLSQSNIDELSEIYSEKLKGGVTTLLTEAKNLAENIGSYYTEKRRSKANAAASTAIESTEKISNVLEEDPRYS
jgi:hypothetical protein